MMSVYLIIEITIIDQKLYSEYVDRVYDVVVRNGGRYVVRGGHITPLNGGWQPQRVVIINFPDREAIQKCFNSPDYLALAPLREYSTQSKAIIVDGFIPNKEGG